MPRQRHISPGFFTHPALYEHEARTGLPLRVAYAGLWCHADREGRFEWKPPVLKLGILPFDGVDFDRVLLALAEAEFIVRYEVDGRIYGMIPTFLRHQHPHAKEAPSKLPAPGAHHTSTMPTPVKHEASTRKAPEEPAGVSGLQAFRPSGSSEGSDNGESSRHGPTHIAKIIPEALRALREQV